MKCFLKDGKRKYLSETRCHHRNCNSGEEGSLKVRKQMRNKVDACNIQAVLATCARSDEQVKAFLGTLLNSTSVKYLFIHISELYSFALIVTITTQNPQRNVVPKNKLIFKLVSLNHFYYYASQKLDIKKKNL